MTVEGWETGVLVELADFSQSGTIEEWQRRLLGISERFNRQMEIIMTVEWIAFSLAVLALILLVRGHIRRNRKRNGRHSR